MTAWLESSICVGTLRHRRFHPVAHRFDYPVAMAFLDVDRIPELMAVSRLTAYNRWGWASFDDRDHLAPPGWSLRARVEADALRQGVALPEGRMFLLTQLRHAGYCFNPVSFFYCFNSRGMLARVLAEVSNTFGGRHHYWLHAGSGLREPMPSYAPASESRPTTFRSAARKAMDVSPFVPGQADYTFAFTAPTDRMAVHMTVTPLGAPGASLDATLTLSRRPWTARYIRRTLVQFPLTTMKTMAAIHWEAWRIWRKGVPLVTSPGHSRATR